MADSAETIITEQAYPEGQYARVEVLGHVRHIGRFQEVERFGQKFCQVEPIYDGEFQPAILVGGTSIYQFTEITAKEAFEIAPKPYRYEQRALPDYSGAEVDDDDDGICF